MPRLAIENLLQQFVDFYMTAIEEQSLNSEMQELLLQSSENLTELGTRFDLMGLLVSREMMHVPNIMAYVEPSLDVVSRQINSIPEILGLSMLFILLSMLIGVIYLRMLATRFRAPSALSTGAVGVASRTAADPEKVDGQSAPVDVVAFATDSARQWVRIMFFFFIMICVLLAFYFPVSFVIIFMMMLSPAVGAFGATILSAILFMLFFYLYFATIGMVLDDLPIFAAITRSFKLMRQHFWASIGIILLVYFITQGIGMLLRQVTLYEPIGTVAAILCNAYIGTGLVLALLHFYRERVVGLE